jgi:hypothetical protein
LFSSKKEERGREGRVREWEEELSIGSRAGGNNRKRACRAQLLSGPEILPELSSSVEKYQIMAHLNNEAIDKITDTDNRYRLI